MPSFLTLSKVGTLLTLLPCLSTPLLAQSVNGSENPTIVIVPNAWHTPKHWFLYIDYLEQAGYEVKSEKLDSCDNPNPNLTSVQRDAYFIQKNLLLPSIQSSKEVVLVAHSYAGSPSATAAKGLSVTERRANGQVGGILGLIFVTALTAKFNQSLEDINGGKGPSKFVTDYHNGQLGVKANASERLYNNVNNSTLVDFAVKELKNQSRRATQTPSGYPAWQDTAFDGRRAFAISYKDNAVPYKLQERQVKETNVTWDVGHFDTDHSPFLSQPKKLGDWTISEIKRFKRADTKTMFAGFTGPMLD